MKLLILTQKVDQNDPILGFFHRWILEFAKRAEQVTVICLERGAHSLPGNVQVLSLGKETGVSRLKYLYHFYKYLWTLRNDYDTVFVHMNPIYLVLAGWWWRLTGKKVALWYTHRQVDLKLRVAEKFAQLIFTASKESFNLVSPKVHVVGHGIDVDSFSCAEKSTKPIFLHVGRITRIKNLDILIEAMAQLKQNRSMPFQLWLVGETVTGDDKIYRQELEQLIEKCGLEEVVVWKGAVANSQMKPFYCQALASINLTPTGGVDKSVLESMAAGLPVFTSNRTFYDYFGPYAEAFIFTERDASDLTGKISTYLDSPEPAIHDYLTMIVKQRADITNLINLIYDELNKLA